MEIGFIQYKSLSIRYARRKGTSSNNPIILFNGVGQSVESWAPLLMQMPSQDFIMYDVPGAGLSEYPKAFRWSFKQHANLAYGLLEKLGIEKVDAFGLSWGGALAQQFASLYHSNVERLMLAAAAPGVFMIPGSYSVYAKMWSMKRFSSKNYMSSIAGDIYGGDFRVGDSALQKLNSLQQVQPSNKGYRFQASALLGWSNLPLLCQIKQPTLVLHGIDDPLIPLVNAQLTAKAITNSQIEVLDCGHLFALTRTKQMVGMIERFVE